MRRRLTRQRGAALLLLVAVLGLGLAVLLIEVGKQWQSQLAQERRTFVALGEARDALMGFAIQYGRLPRPAISATDGTESPQPCRDEQACTGFLPWLSLGIGRTDGWGHLLRYSAAPEFTRAPIDFSTAVATKAIQGRVQGQLYYTHGYAACGLSAQCLPAVIFSTGKENFGVSELGIMQAGLSTSNVDERSNVTASVAFIDRAASTQASDAGGEFDDLVSWLPLLPLINRVNATH